MIHSLLVHQLFIFGLKGQHHPYINFERKSSADWKLLEGINYSSTPETNKQTHSHKTSVPVCDLTVPTSGRCSVMNNKQQPHFPSEALQYLKHKK